MPALTCPLIPLDAVRVGEVTIVPDATRPVAAIVAADSTVGWVVWPDAPMPDRAIGETRLWPTSTGAWLDYTAEESWKADLERQRQAVDAWTDRLELHGVDGIEWPLAPVAEEARSSAITRIRARFEGLADPYLMWTSDDHAVRSSPSDYRAVEIVESGEWPGTEISVSFEHRRVHDLRLRRRYRVFDDAGRPRTWAYAAIHLEEDIATGAVPPRSAAVDGVLEI